MKTDIHPNYRAVVFQDTSSDLAFLTKSTIDTSDTIEWEDGNTYPLAKVEISSASHPFYTGKQILVDTTGRVERFRKRYGKTPAKKTAAVVEAVEEAIVEAEIEVVEEAIVEAEIEVVEEAIVEAEIEAVEEAIVEAVVEAELEAEAEVVLEAELITEADTEA